jgi:hypothetical protein
LVGVDSTDTDVDSEHPSSSDVTCSGFCFLACAPSERE